MKMRFFTAVLVSICFPCLVFAVSPNISAGGLHVLALKENGEVWAWSTNNEEQLGQSSGGHSPTAPIKIWLPMGCSGIQVAGGGEHSLVLLDDGTVLSFGRNKKGQLGTEKNEKNPSVISGLTDVTAIAAGAYHNIILKKDGSVWSFGWNQYGQLGDGTKLDRSTPVQVPGLSDIIAIAAGWGNSYALKRDGSVLKWGYYVPRSGKADHQTMPVQVENLTGIIAIATGFAHTSALKNDGTVWSWGWSYKGQLGNNDIGNKDNGFNYQLPQQAQGINDAVEISVGTQHTVVLRSDGSMWTFGSNEYGQLGIEEAWANSTIAVPQASVLTKDVVNVTASGNTTFALKRDGTISAFGSPSYGKMGDGHMSSIFRPVQVYEETKASKVSCGASHSVLRRTDGTVGWIGFYNTQKKPVIGERSPDEQSYQLKVLSSLANITQVASGDQHTVVLKSDGTVWAYGMGDKGQLGDGNSTTSMMPVQVSGITGAIAVAAGGSSSLAIKDDHSVVTWGDNSFGQLGDGTTINRATPVIINGLTQITAAAMGKNHAIARKADGTVWIWGKNDSRQLLENNASTISTPQQVPNLTQGETVAAGDEFSLVLLANKSVSAWGINWYGQLGLGDKELREKPTIIPGLRDVVQIAAGSSHSIVRLQNGTLKAWGLNEYGQLGDETCSNRLSPVIVKDLRGITDIAAGNKHSVAIRSDSTAWSWGTNEKEQLGVSATRQHRSAIRLITDNGDTDSDGMPDELERIYFGDLSHTGVADTDKDGWTDIREILLGTDPTLADTDGDNLTDIADSSTSLDLDKDGMPDAWERRHFGNTRVTPDADSDGDGVANIQEYQNGTIPVLPFRSGITFVPDFSKENRIANTILANSTRSVDPEVTVARPCEGGAF